MKHRTALLLLCTMVLSCTACGKETQTTSTAELPTEAGTAPMVTEAPAEETETSLAEETTEASVTETETTPTEAETSAEETETTPDTTAASEETDPSDAFYLAEGFWLAKGSQDNQYLYFNSDCSTGHFANESDGSKLAFTYLLEGDTLTISADASEPAIGKITWTDEHDAVIVWENGYTEEFSHLNMMTPDTYNFFSDEQLCGMALRYYAAMHDYTPSKAAAETQEDGSVLIQLYDDLEDHNSTSDWYTVNRFTAEGTNLQGEEINLTEVQ